MCFVFYLIFGKGKEFITNSANFINEKLDRSPLVDQKRVVLSIAKMLQNLSFKKINRRDNEVAHEIAKFSFNSRSDGLLVNSVPPCVVYAVMTDCNNLLFN